LNVSSLVNQQFDFALKLIEFATDEKIGVGHDRFTHHAFVQSVFLQWDLAIRFWFEEQGTSSSSSVELRQLFESHQPIHELSLSQLLSRVEKYVSMVGMYCDVSLGLLIDYRSNKGSWLFVLENALRSFCMSEREWDSQYLDKADADASEVPSNHGGGVDGLAQSVVLIASTEAVEATSLQGKHWRNIELKYLHQLICDSRQFIDDGRNLNAEN